MWSMPVDLTETENENDSAKQNDVAKRVKPSRFQHSFSNYYRNGLYGV